MAKRESQGMQIALILLVMLSVLFAITTVVFWNIAKNTKAELAQKTSSEQSANANMRKTIDENQQLKVMLGHTADVPLDAIQNGFKTDMEKFGANFPAEERNYRALPEFLNTTNMQLHGELTSAQARINELESSNTQFKKEMDQQIAAARKEKDDATKEYLAQRNNFATEVRKAQSQGNKSKMQWEAIRKKLNIQVDELESKVSQLNDQLTDMKNSNDKISLELSQLRTESFDRPDGKVTWVDNRGNTVYINLGSRDRLRRQTTFSVYDIDVNNLARTKKKASVEVTRVLGDHLAEARVINEEIGNPIVHGDIIFSPIWEVGNPIRFALTGFMDIDKDGVSDRDLIRRLIKINGGVIDAEVGDDGSRTGDMTVETRYLVTGKHSSEGGASGFAADSRIRTEAKSLGLTSISVDRLLSDIGYQRISKTIALGQDSKERDYRENSYDHQ